MASPTPLPLPKGYKRLGAFPIDDDSVFATQAALDAYLAGGSSYPGQFVSIADQANNNYQGFITGSNGKLIPLIERLTKTLVINANSIVLDFENLRQLLGNNLTLITANTNISISNAPLVAECQFRVDITNMATLTFPIGTYMQDSEDRWSGESRTFTPESDGQYEVVITIVGGDYYLKISDLMISL